MAERVLGLSAITAVCPTRASNAAVSATNYPIYSLGDQGLYTQSKSLAGHWHPMRWPLPPVTPIYSLGDQGLYTQSKSLAGPWLGWGAPASRPVRSWAGCWARRWPGRRRCAPGRCRTPRAPPRRPPARAPHTPARVRGLLYLKTLDFDSVASGLIQARYSCMASQQGDVCHVRLLCALPASSRRAPAGRAASSRAAQTWHASPRSATRGSRPGPHPTAPAPGPGPCPAQAPPWGPAHSGAVVSTPLHTGLDSTT